MSNPAVSKLQNCYISKSHVWLDDNIGESIHIHIDDYRVDLSYTEFHDLCYDIEEAINRLVNVEGFDLHSISSVYFEVMLADNLLHLVKIKMDEVNLKDLLCAVGDGTFRRIPDSRGVKALNGDEKENNVYRSSHLNGQTSQERLEGIYNSIKNNGYPYKNEYIVLYGDSNVIKDGQHRASCLWQLYGDKTVPVMRMYFDNGNDSIITETPAWKKNPLYRFLVKTYTGTVKGCKSGIATLRNPRRIYSWVKKKKKAREIAKKEKQMKRYLRKNKQEYETVKAIFDGK